MPPACNTARPLPGVLPTSAHQCPRGTCSGQPFSRGSETPPREGCGRHSKAPQWAVDPQHACAHTAKDCTARKRTNSCITDQRVSAWTPRERRQTQKQTDRRTPTTQSSERGTVTSDDQGQTSGCLWGRLTGQGHERSCKPGNVLHLGVLGGYMSLRTC